jgi:dipeptidyl aminopeptidase/acylaminoacyl peptidase
MGQRQAQHAVRDGTKEGGARKLIADIGVPNMEFALQQDGTARFAYGENDDNVFVAYRKDGDGDWQKLDLGAANVRFEPFALSADNKDVFAYYSADGGPLALVRQSMASGERALLASDAFASVGGLQWGGTPRQPFAANVGAGAPQLVYFDAQRPEAQLHKALAAKFAGNYLDLISISTDNSKFLFDVSSDRDPGSYYLFDPQAKRMAKLFATMPWIDQAKMAERRAVRFMASDGVELAGFLTLPPGREAKNLPLVLLPHGGPHGVQDGWLFDDDAQFLANRGYAVLQVNYRGSGGRGIDFMTAGYLKWGTRIQDDLLDGVRWAIKEGTVDAKRVCVYGASFGGYSAMMTAIRAPDLIKCAVGYAGVYDLAMMHDKGDIQQRKSGRNYLDEVIGKDAAELKANSPVNLVDKLKAPVLIVHGEADERAPFAHAKALRNALDKAHKPYEWFAVAKEGHGFYTEEHRRQFYEKLEAFLAKHLAP